MRKLCLPFVLLLVFLAAPVWAAPIVTFYSGDGGDVLVSSVVPGAVTVITPHPVWGDISDEAGMAAGTAEWISYTNTGVGGVIASNVASRTLAHATVHFARMFQISASGSFEGWFLTDDTAEVWLSGPAGYSEQLFAPVLTQIDPCAPGNTGNVIGCTDVSAGHVLRTALAGGLYTLDVYGYQTNGDVFGVQYAGAYSVPEPAAMLMLGIGLVGAGAHFRRKRR